MFDRPYVQFAVVVVLRAGHLFACTKRNFLPKRHNRECGHPPRYLGCSQYRSGLLEWRKFEPSQCPSPKVQANGSAPSTETVYMISDPYIV